MRKILILALCFASTIFGQEREVLVLSTPRSGTHWTLYCLSALLEKRVIVNRGPAQVEKFRKYFPEHDNGFIYSAHNPKDLYIRKEGLDTDILVLVVRNYREALIRSYETPKAIIGQLIAESKFNKLDEMRARVALIQPHNHYFNNLRSYDKWNNKNKIIVYYEDIVSNPRRVMEQFVELFHVKNGNKKVDEFISDLSKHRNCCFEEYKTQGGSKSFGKDFLFHSKKVGLRKSQTIDNCVEMNFPYYFNKYLKHYKCNKQDFIEKKKLPSKRGDT